MSCESYERVERRKECVYSQISRINTSDSEERVPEVSFDIFRIKVGIMDNTVYKRDDNKCERSYYYENKRKQVVSSLYLD